MSAPDWSRKHHEFRHLDGGDAGWRSATPGRPRRRASDSVTRLWQAIGLMAAFYAVVGAVIWLGIRDLGVHP